MRIFPEIKTFLRLKGLTNLGKTDSKSSMQKQINFIYNI